MKIKQFILRNKNLLINISLAIGSVIFFILLFEGGSFIYYVLRHKTTKIESNPTEFKAYELFGYKSNAVTPPYVKGAVNLVIDKYGFISNGLERDYDFNHQGITRILIFGGSTVAGFGVVDQKNTIAGSLERGLSKKYPDKKFEVINMGVQGYNSFQEFLYLKEIGDWLNPQIVIFFDGFNDMHYSYLKSAKVFESFYNRKDFIPRLAELEEGLNKETPFLVNREYLQTHSYFFRGFFSLIDQVIQKLHKRKIISTELCGIDKKGIETTVLNYVDNLKLAKFLTELKGRKFYTFIQPVFAFKELTPEEKANFQSIDYVQFNKSICSAEDRNFYYEYAREFFNSVAKIVNNKKGFYDFTHLFKNNNKETLFIDDIHYNDLGNEIIAENILRAINAEIK